MKWLKRISAAAVLGLAAFGAANLWPSVEPVVDVDLKVYDGAGHGWDNPYPQHFVADAVGTATRWVTTRAPIASLLWTSGNSCTAPGNWTVRRSP